MYLQKGISIKTWRKKNIFCWRLEGHRRKEQYPEPDPIVKDTDPDPFQKSRIQNSASLVPVILKIYKLAAKAFQRPIFNLHSFIAAALSSLPLYFRVFLLFNFSSPFTGGNKFSFASFKKTSLFYHLWRPNHRYGVSSQSSAHGGIWRTMLCRLY
jgi:hypothetical protein